jgi:hypothetical protein
MVLVFSSVIRLMLPVSESGKQRGEAAKSDCDWAAEAGSASRAGRWLDAEQSKKQKAAQRGPAAASAVIDNTSRSRELWLWL